VRRWARIVFGLLAALAGGLIVFTAIVVDALAEEGDTTQGTGLMIGLGSAIVVLGLAATAIPWADLGALLIIALVFLLAYGGEAPNGDSLYMAIAGVALLLLGPVSISGHRGAGGTRGARRASAAAAASRDAPSEAPSGQDAEPDGRAPPS
jgi:hypothetical protein